MWYDLIVLGILLVAAYRGLQRGVIYQLAAIASVVLCFVFAEAISAAAAPMVPLQPPLNNWVVMVGAFVAFSFVSFGAARVLDAAVEKAKMREFNRHLGAAFGAVKGAALCLVLTFFLVTMSTKTHDALAQSRAARVATTIMYKIHPVMPEKLQVAVERYLYQAEQIGLPRTQIADGQGDTLAGGLGEPAGWPAGGDGLGGDVPGSDFDPFAGQSDPFGNPSGGGNDVAGGGWGGPTLSDPTGLPDSRTGRPNDGGFGYDRGTPAGRPPAPSDPYSVEAILDRLPYTITSDGERYLREVLGRTPAADRPRLEQQLRNSGPSMVADAARKYFGISTPDGRPAGDSLRDAVGGMARDEYDRRFGGSAGGDLIGDAAGRLYDRRTGGSTNTFEDDAKDVVSDVARGLLDRRFGGGSRPDAGRQTSGGQPSGGGIGDFLGGVLNQQPRVDPLTQSMRDLAATFRPDPAEQAGVVSQLQQMFAGTPREVAIAAMADWTADRRPGSVDPDPNTDASTKVDLRIRAATQRLGRTQMGSGGGAYNPFQ